jgi:hypothetical protein
MITQDLSFKSGHQTLWHDDMSIYYIVSTINSKYGKETMVFYSTYDGTVTSYESLHVDYDIDKPHTEVIKEFLTTKDQHNTESILKEVNNGS